MFLAGDAAHRHPPANGLGTNTSIQDSYNLCWKLREVLRGAAGPELLDTYDAERQPVGRQVVDRAMKSVGDMAPISAALGFRPGQDADEGWESLAALRADTDTGRKRRIELAAAVDLQNYQFNCHGVELDQHYDSAAVVDDGTPWPVPQRDPELFHHPTTHSGAHLPHAWLQRGDEPVSTLDLCGSGRFTLLTGIGGEAWRAAAADLQVDVVTIGPGCDAQDVTGDWASLREIEENGCLLVRPDAHIAWRQERLVDDPVDALRTALDQLRIGG